jgi:hypothetical protein
MNFLSRLIMILVISISLAAPVGAAVVVSEPGVTCEVVAADDDKKTDDTKNPEDEEEEPDCD